MTYLYDSDHKFTARERDGGNTFSPTGLDNFGARFYSSSMARFMSPDPAGMLAVRLAFPQTLDRYAYASNNPTSVIDPYGLDCAYLNDAGNGLESEDQNSNSEECGKNGGYWIEGALVDYQNRFENRIGDAVGHNDGRRRQWQSVVHVCTVPGHESEC